MAKDTKKTKKTKKTYDEYKLKVETKSGDVMKIKATFFARRDDRQGVNLVIMDDLVIKGIWIINGKHGPFVSMPAYKDGDSWSEFVHPVSAEFRESLYAQLVKLSAFDEPFDEDGDDEEND